MANKRSTKRERRDEAKRRRLEELRRRQRQARLRKIASYSVVGLGVAGLIALIVVVRSGGGENDANAVRLAQAGGCSSVESPGVVTSTHVAPPLTVRYATNPPTSGNHYGSTAQTGIHGTPVQNELQVHNLEHGHVVFQYQEGLDPAILQGLGAIVKGNRTVTILAPNPNIDAPLAFSAWGKLQKCATPNVAAVEAAKDFFRRFRDHAPERVAGTPLAVDAPLPTPTASPSPSPTATSS